MAWYSGTYNCGHEGRVNIIGPVKDREWKKEREFSKMCPDCRRKKFEEEREQKTQESFEKAKEMDLPELTGSEKQIAWAITLRQQLLDEINGISDLEKKTLLKRYGITDEDIQKIKQYIIETKTSAKYYIDRRHNLVRDYILEEKDAALAYFSEKESGEKELETESIIFPEKRQTDSVVTIDFGKDYASASFEKNEAFRKIVKDLGFTWNGSAWEKEISETTGSAEDRAAELGNKLLNAGFPIRIYDEEIRRKAIEGDFEPEYHRWIYHQKGTEKFAIRWKGFDDDLYRKAKSLPGARWNSGFMLVGVEHYDVVEEFAELYGFRFTTAARRMIDEYKEAVKNIQTVSPAKVEEPALKDGLKELLESEAIILDDLKD